MKNLFTRKSWRDAVTDVYYGRGCQMHSPAIWWRDGKLVVSSALTPECGGHLIHQANFSANTGNKTAPTWDDALSDVSDYIRKFETETI